MSPQDRKTQRTVTKEVRNQTIGYIVAAFGLVAGLAWNEAVKGLIDILFPLQQNSLVAKFIYAGIVTSFVIIISVYLQSSKND